jgi:uncharacterized protein YjbI with pentapeptide repeats
MRQQELKHILDLHRKWFIGEPEGERANLSYADLSRADLRYANLSDANLSYANLRYANLSCADLSCSDLRYADLSRAKCDDIKDDFLSVLAVAKNETTGLYKALLEGKIDALNIKESAPVL